MKKTCEYMKKYVEENLRKKSYATIFNFRCENCKNFMTDYRDKFRCKKFRRLLSLREAAKQHREKYLKKYFKESQESWDGDLLDFIPSLRDRKEQELEKSKKTTKERYLLRQPEYANNLRYLEKEMQKTEKKIVSCLISRAFRAVNEGKRYFWNQEFCIADCDVCKHYERDMNYCLQRGYPFKKRRGICEFFELDKDKFRMKNCEDDDWY